MSDGSWFLFAYYSSAPTDLCRLQTVRNGWFFVTDRVKERIWSPGEPDRVRLGQAADEHECSAGVRHSTGLGLVVTVSTSNRIVRHGCQVTGVGRVFRPNVGSRRLSAGVMVAFRPQRSANYERRRRLAQQPEHALRHAASVATRVPALAAEMPVRGTKSVHSTRSWSATQTAVGQLCDRQPPTVGRQGPVRHGHRPYLRDSCNRRQCHIPVESLVPLCYCLVSSPMQPLVATRHAGLCQCCLRRRSSQWLFVIRFTN